MGAFKCPCGSGEKGIFICSWDNDGITDCNVAFFGYEWPKEGEQPENIYVLRYYASSLELAE
jgi:hypothetical protein